MELIPISASLGAMGSLPRKLDELVATRNWALRGVVMDELEQLTTAFHTLHNFLVKLSNAEDPPMTARYWMKDVRELSYDMVDWVDQFVHAHNRDKIPRATRRKRMTRLKINRLPGRWKWRPWITNKVSEFRTRAQEATQRYRRYKFHGRASNPGYSRVGGELPTMSDPGDLVGIEGSMKELGRWFTNNEEQLKVVSIVGAGGIGKSTLAQKLFAKHHRQFECHAFVRTAQKPDMRGILRNILLQVRPQQAPDSGEMHQLIHDLRKYLHDKRYFIIIDDLWATSVWDVVSRAFPEGDCCSRIITTTEIMEVALACSGFSREHILKMEPLSDDDSEKLFIQRIHVSGNQSPQRFDDVLPKIKKKCGGLPLAIIIVASILVSQPEKLKQWDCLENSYGSSFGANPTMQGFMRQILDLSFNSLPHYLKTCLLHLSTYPEGCQFVKDDLVKQWVAEQFICAHKKEDMEEVAESYFDELVSTGLIQAMDINYDYELSYSVHHMVLDFITYKSIEENFITVVDYSETTIPLNDVVCRLSLHFGSATYATTPASTRLSQVRSLFFSGLFNCMPSFMEFKLLRILILHFWGDTGNMSLNLTGICELFRLRYLQVTCNVTLKLPDQIKGMKHLETLDISGGVCDVPPDIVRLSGLLHLRIRGGTNLPDGIGCMRSLRTLMFFDLGKSTEDNIWGLGELTNLRHLHLTYSSSPSSEKLKRNLVTLASALGKLCNLRSLTLAAGTTGTGVLFDGWGGMSIPVSLERLELLPPICIFSRIPEWIGHLRKICIMKVAVRELLTNDIDILTGLPSLTLLSLRVQTVPEGRTVFRSGAFPVLKYFNFSCAVLCMSFMPGAMPNLRRLDLRFNTHLGEKYSNMLEGSEHLLNLQDIAGRIGAATESDWKIAESAIKNAISEHPRCPRLNVQWVDLVKEEYCPPQKQHGKQEKGSTDEVLEKTEEMKEHANSGLSVLPDLPSTVTSPPDKKETVTSPHGEKNVTVTSPPVKKRAVTSPRVKSGIKVAPSKAKVQDGYVSYPWNKKMSDSLPIPNSSCYLSMLVLPMALDLSICPHEPFEGTLARAEKWLYSSQASGVPIEFTSVQSEAYTTISGESRSATVNSDSLFDMDTGMVKAVRLWYNSIAGEMPLEIKLQEGDMKLGFAISRTEEGFICVSSVVDKDTETPSTRSGLRDLFNRSKKASKLLVISRLFDEMILPSLISSSGEIRCFDTVSLSQKLSFYRKLMKPFRLHLLMWEKPVDLVQKIIGSPEMPQQSMLPEGPQYSLKTSGVRRIIGSEEYHFLREGREYRNEINMGLSKEPAYKTLRWRSEGKGDQGGVQDVGTKITGKKTQESSRQSSSTAS